MNETSEFFETVSPSSGDVFSDYVTIAENGTSRLGTVTRYDRRFFVKSIASRYADMHLYQLQLRKEFKLLLELNHPGIVRVYELCEIPGVGLSMLMEYVNGLTLTEFITKASRTRRRRVARRIIEAVDYIHSRGITHGDLKPDNIMVLYGGDAVKIIDFGLGDAADFTVLKVAGGTLSYAAPERLRPGCAPSPSADVFSLGKIFRDMRLGLPYRRLIHCALQLSANRRPADAAALSRILAKNRLYAAILCGAAAIAALITIL